MLYLIVMSTENYEQKYQHEVLDAELLEFSAVRKWQDFYTMYVKFKYGSLQTTENWFMITEHKDTYHSRLTHIRKMGAQYKIGDKFDFKFEIKSIPNKSNKLKIKSITPKY